MHSYSNRTHINTRVHTNVALSCFHFTMFGVETRAAQPLKTGDNICPPCLSVLPSIMVRPFSPLRLFILQSLTPLPFFLLHSTSSHPICPASRARSSAIPLLLSFSFFHCSLFFIHCLSLRRHIEFLSTSSSSVHCFEYKLLSSIHCCLSFALNSFLLMMNVPFVCQNHLR